MRGAGFVTKRNSDRVLLFTLIIYYHLKMMVLLIAALGALRLEQYHIVYFIVKWPYVSCFFSKITKPSPFLRLHVKAKFFKNYRFQKIYPQTQKFDEKNSKFRRKSEKRTTSRTPP